MIMTEDFDIPLHYLEQSIVVNPKRDIPNTQIHIIEDDHLPDIKPLSIDQKFTWYNPDIYPYDNSHLYSFLNPEDLAFFEKISQIESLGRLQSRPDPHDWMNIRKIKVRIFSGHEAFIKCNSKKLWIRAERDYPHDVKYIPYTCNQITCNNPSCIEHRKQRIEKAYKTSIKNIIKLSQEKREKPLFVYSMSLTSNIRFSKKEDLDFFRSKVNYFIRKNKKIFSALIGFHVVQSRIHAHLIILSRYLDFKRVNQAWKKYTKWTDTKFEKIDNKNLVGSHLRHLTRYMARPYNPKKETEDFRFILFTELYGSRLLTTHNKNKIKNIWPEKIDPEYNIDQNLYLSRNDSLFLVTCHNSENLGLDIMSFSSTNNQSSLRDYG